MRYAVCNEMFGAMEFRRQAEMAARHGFDGIEIAPFTLFGDFSPAAVRKGVAEARHGLADAGLDFAGFHWLLAKPDGLHVTARDATVRQRSWDHLDMLSDACGELGGGPMTFGSPKQRSSRGIPHEEALGYFTEGLAAAGPRAAANYSLILLESLPFADTDIMNTLRDARAVLQAADAPGLSSMFDFHNTVNETDPWEKLVADNADIIRHVHINTMDGGWPRPDNAALRPVFSVLTSLGYDGWASLEIFTVPEEPDRVLAETREFLRRAVA